MLSLYPLVYADIRSPSPLGEPLGPLLIRRARLAWRARCRRKALEARASAPRLGAAPACAARPCGLAA